MGCAIPSFICTIKNCLIIKKQNYGLKFIKREKNKIGNHYC